MIELPSLNDIVEDGFGYLREHTDFETEFRLDDQMPRIYTPVRGELYSVEQAIRTHLPQEDWRHGRGDRRITTRLEGEYQILEVDHSGKHLPVNELQYLNETLQRIEEGEELLNGRFRPSGNNMAARGLREGNGTVQYENINDGQYRIRCIVRLPLIEAQP